MDGKTTTRVGLEPLQIEIPRGIRSDVDKVEATKYARTKVMGAKVDNLLDSGSMVIFFSEDLVAELQEQVSGRAQVTSAFEREDRVDSAFGQERTITTQNAPHIFMIDTAWGKVRFKVWFEVLPEERELVYIGQNTLGNELSTDTMLGRRRTLISFSGNGKGPGCERGDLEIQVNVISDRVSTVRKLVLWNLLGDPDEARSRTH